MTSYSLENAKSGRSGCKNKDCKQNIEKGCLRIGESSDAGDYVMTKWFHLECFKVPPKFKRDGVSIEDFVSSVLSDATDDKILSDTLKRNEIIELFKSSGQRKRKNPGHSEDDVENEPVSAEELVDKIKRDFEQWKRMADETEEDTGKSRNQKKKDAGKTQKILTDQDRNRVEAYENYASMTNEELKNVLRWNRQILSGNHAVLLVRVIDGHMHGRLAKCPACGTGRLRLADDGSAITCQGQFDEQTKVRYPCATKLKPVNAPRIHPWYQNKPSKEEEEEMDAAIEESGSSNISNEVVQDVKTNLSRQAMSLDWNLSTNEGIKKAASDLLELCKSSESVIDLPEDPTVARMEVGKILIGNREKSAEDVLKILVDRFGLKKVKEESKKARIDAIGTSCSHPANAPVIAAMSELSKLYFTERNNNAGSTYAKVAVALSSIPFEINAENALGLGKGKTKVNNIGTSSAEKIHEFVTTGKIAKLEEKRAALM